MKAVIQCGGQGARLRPFTLVLPKPLLPLGKTSTIEVILQWLRRNGITQVYMTTGYLSTLMQAVCGDGSKWDLNIQYTYEDSPLSTVGPLHLIGREALNETFIMLNGDIITDLNLQHLIENHKQNDRILTIACYEKKVKSDFGVLNVDGSQVVGFQEKPEFSHHVSMGIYYFEPDIFDHIPQKIAFGFDDLMYTLLHKNIPINAYLHNGSWLDIGRPDDYAMAQEMFLQTCEISAS